MNTGFLHYLRKEYHCKGQQNNQDSIFSGTHGLLVLFYRHFQINSEVRVLNIFDTGILIIYKKQQLKNIEKNNKKCIDNNNMLCYNQLCD